jgi:hypothetical protein
MKNIKRRDFIEASTLASVSGSLLSPSMAQGMHNSLSEKYA